MKNFIKIDIECTSTEECDVLIAELSENSYYAFEQNENHLSAYIEDIDFNEEKLQNVLGRDRKYVSSIIEDKNWNSEWESQFHPVTVNNFAGIRASFHQPLKNIEHEIIITPKMSFGTGHHATTFLMIELMQKIDFRNKTVVDFGTGTAVLAILAEKLGAAQVLAIDYDEWSINNATENIKTNICKNIIIEQRDNIRDLSNVDVMIANINFNILEENADNFFSALKKESTLLISGILARDEKNIISTFEKNGFVKRQICKKDGWIALMFGRQ